MKYLSHAYSQASGKIGGSVYSHARGTLIVRAYRKPVNPNTSFQQVVRNGLGALQTAFRTTLTSAQRAAWAVFAQNMTYVDVLGNSTHLTAQQWYVSLNNPRLQASVARVDPGPTIYAADYLTAPAPTLAAAGTTASSPYTNTDAWANEAGGYLLVYASRPQNSTQTGVNTIDITMDDTVVSGDDWTLSGQPNWLATAVSTGTGVST